MVIQVSLYCFLFVDRSFWWVSSLTASRVSLAAGQRQLSPSLFLFLISRSRRRKNSCISRSLQNKINIKTARATARARNVGESSLAKDLFNLQNSCATNWLISHRNVSLIQVRRTELVVGSRPKQNTRELWFLCFTFSCFPRRLCLVLCLEHLLKIIITA